MKNLMKKIVVSIVGLSMVVMMVPGIAQGVTAEELQAQIASLTAQLTALQAQLTALTGAPAAAACTFTRALYPGVSGADVKCLQQYLNGAGYALAVSGVGSAGNETQYYGPLTQAAVKKWQDANGVVYGAYGGYFGPISQAKYTALAAAAPAEEEEEEEEEVPEGITTPGAEGSLVATIYSSPASGQEVYTKTTNQGVAAVEVQAVGSDILVKRFDVNFDHRPWLYIKNLIITDGTTSKTIAVTSSNSSEITVGSSYTIIVDSLSFLVPKGTKKVLTVKVDAVDEMPSGDTTEDIILTISANALRGIDGASIDQYAPTSALSTRTFTVKSGDTANIEITAAPDNPKDQSLVVQSTGETTGVTLAKINVKATNRDAILRSLKVKDANASGTGGTLKVIYLYDGGTQLSSTSSITSATATIDNIGLTIPKDTTKVLTIKGDYVKAQGNYVTGATSTNASSVITTDTSKATSASADGSWFAEDASTFTAATTSGSDVTGAAYYLYQKAPSLALSSASISSVSVATGTIAYNGKADARIRINVTANGGDIYIASTTAAVDTGATSTIGASATIVRTVTSDADVTSGTENFKITSGSTKYVEFYAQLTRVDDSNSSTVGDLSTYAYVNPITWQDATFNDVGDNITQDWGLTDFKTGSVVLEYFR